MPGFLSLQLNASGSACVYRLLWSWWSNHCWDFGGNNLNNTYVLGVIGLKFGPFSLVTAGTEGDFFVVLFVVSPQASV